MAPRASVAAPRTSFIGRERELEQLTGLLDRDARLITVVGPPGMGKTRLVRRLFELGTGAEAGAGFVDLAAARSSEDFIAATARALGVGLEQSRDPAGGAAAVGAALCALGRFVMALDNFEQLLPGGCEPLRSWLDAAPAAVFIVTSREALRLAGEVSLEVSPLGLPPADVADLEAINRSEAGRLFLERAPEHGLRSEEAPLVADIVRRLEGIPLALELAASRLKVLGPAQMHARLERRLDLLTGGARDAGRRHATLKAAIDWSWMLLEPLDRSVLAQLSVFPGPFSLEAAEAVVEIAGDDDGAPPAEAIVAGLVDKSLVRSEPASDAPGLVLLSLYATIREYVQVAPDVAQVVDGARQRHLAYCRQQAIELSRPAGADAAGSPRLAMNFDDFIAAAEYGNARPPDVETLDSVLEVVAALDALIIDQLPLTRYVALLDRAIARGEEAGAGRIPLAGALAARARAHHYFGRFDESRADAERALGLAGDDAPAALQARIHLRLGILTRVARDDQASAHHLSTALACARRAQDSALVGTLLLQQAYLAADRGALTQGIRLCGEGLAAAGEAGDTYLEARARLAFLYFYARLGRSDDARREFVRFARLARDHPYLYVEGFARIYVGGACQEAGRLRQAMAHYRRAVELGRALRVIRMEGGALTTFSGALYEVGRFEEGARMCERALMLLRRTSDSQWQAECLARLAASEAAMDHVLEAEAHLTEATALLEGIDNAGLRGAIDLYFGLIDLARARAAREGDPAPAELRERALRRLEASRRTRELYEQSDELRLAHRNLRKAITSGCYVVSRDGTRFRCPGAGEEVTLLHRPTLASILAALLEAHLEAPGSILSADAVVAAGWPDERMRNQSALNRVRVAIATLRGLGLRDLLVSRGSGYLLDPGRPIIVADRLE